MRILIRKEACLLITLLLIQISLFGQEFHFKSYSVGDGLSQSRVNSIALDKDRIIWIGTEGGGLCMFDGVDFYCFSQEDGLPSNQVNDILIDAGGTIWAATDRGVIRIYKATLFQNKIEFNVYSRTNSNLPSDNVNCIYQNTNGQIIIGTSLGSCIYDPNNETSNRPFIPSSSYRTGRNVIAITETADGLLWEASATAVFNGNDTYFSGEQIEGINTIHPFKKNQLLVGSRNGLWLFAGRKFLPYYVDLNGKFDIHDIQTDGNQILLATNKGLIKVSMESSSFYGLDEGLPTQEILDLMKDEEGNIWMGTNGGGLVKFPRPMFTRFPMQREVTTLVKTISEDAYGQIWFGAQSGLFNYNGADINPVLISNLFRQFSVGAIYSASDGTVWYGLEDYGLFNYKEGSINNFPVWDDPGKVRINHITEWNDKLVIASNRGLVIKVKNRFEFIDSTYGFTRDNVNALMPEGDHLWIGTRTGLFKISQLETDQKSAELEPFQQSEGLTSMNVKSIRRLSTGSLILATDEGIILIADQNKGGQINYRQVSVKDGISSGFINLLLEDREKNVWIGSNQGLDRIHVNDLEAGTYNWIHYGTDEGFTGLECQPRAVCEDQSGNIWFGTIKGALRYDPTNDIVVREPPELHMKNVTVFQEPVQFEQSDQQTIQQEEKAPYITLPHNQNYITFNYIGISHAAPEKVRYQYILEGYDQEWQSISNNSYASYSLLPPGNYTFKVQACNNYGVWSEKALAFPFRISPPFWQTTWFRVLSVLAILIIIGLIFYSYFNRKVRKNELAQQMANLKLNALRAQMNPHFVFNSLNSIQNFINKNDEESANIYLARFAALMRLILENSQKSELSVAEEVKTLKLYLDLEKLRFKEKFEYTILIDPQIDQNDVFLPAMLVQPYVENAVNHGMMHKKDPGRIDVSIRKEQGYILCIVEDDGIGREAAMTIKQNQQLPHKSAAMGISKNRIEIINELSQKDLSIQVIDLKNSEGIASGTKVEIRVPLKLFRYI